MWSDAISPTQDMFKCRYLLTKYDSSFSPTQYFKENVLREPVCSSILLFAEHWQENLRISTMISLGNPTFNKVQSDVKIISFLHICKFFQISEFIILYKFISSFTSSFNSEIKIFPIKHFWYKKIIFASILKQKMHIFPPLLQFLARDVWLI